MLDLNHTTVLLTGGTGSFGNAFVETVLARWPQAVVRVYSRDELKQSEMRAKFGEKQVRYLIGDVRDRSRMSRAAQGADIVDVGAQAVNGSLREAGRVALELHMEVGPPVTLEDGAQRRNALALEARVEPGAGIERRQKLGR